MAKTILEVFKNDPWYEWYGNSSAPRPPDPEGQHISQGYQELLVSGGHPLRGLGKHDVGGHFHCVRREYFGSEYGPIFNRTSTSPSGNAYNYFGKYYAHGPVKNSDFPGVPVASNNELDALGTTAIARVIPTNPLVNLVTAMAELRREGIPHIVGAEAMRDRALRARNAGSEYLNYEFGWRPLVNDVLDLANAIINSDEIMKSYERNSGVRLGRSYNYPQEISSEETRVTGQRLVPVIKSGYSTATGVRHTVTTTRSRTWFEGTFTYHLAPQGSLARKEQLAAKRFGLRLTPEVLWNLTPWTWAADWVTNMGDVIHNISAFANDGLVMPWGYVMKETSITKEVFFSGSTLTWSGASPSLSQKWTTTRKLRRKATPFGFGLNPATFSGRQWAILAALGLARGPGQMS